MFHYKLSYIFVSFFLFTNSFIFSQHNSSTDAYYQLFDRYIGEENNSINNGYNANTQTRIIDNSHIFFEQSDFIDAFVIYNNQAYTKKIKYDVYNDHVLVKYINQQNNFTLKLNSEMIDKFEIAQHQFVVLKKDPALNKLYGNGIFEKIYTGKSFELLAKHNKLRHEVLKGDYIGYYFNDKITYLFKYKGIYYTINSRKDILKVLPEYSKTIKKMYKRGILLNSSFLTKLFKHLDNL